MKLDLRQIASSRAGLKTAPGPLDYVSARIRRDLLERLDGGFADCAAVLWIDVLNARAAPPPLRAAQLHHLSLLEQGVDALPDLPAATFDALVIHLQLAWLDYRAILPACVRLLKPGGALLLSTLGPDTLHQLAAAWRQVDAFAHVHGFADLHDIGDCLAALGCKQVVMEADRLMLEYDHALALFRELKREGAHNLLSERRKSLTGKRRFAHFTAALQQLCRQQQRRALTLEVVYGFATAPAAQSATVRVAPPTV